MNLSDTQSLLKQKILNTQADPEILNILKPGKSIPLEKAFQVYHDAYFSTLTRALEKTYPAVRWVTGQTLFHSLAHKFITTEPSVSYDLLSYGKNLPEFLKVLPATSEIPFLPYLAHFEWLYKELLHSPNPDPLPVEQIQNLLRSDDVTLQFIEAIEILTSPVSIYEIWIRREEPPYHFEEIQWNRPENLLLYKKQKKIFVQELNPVEVRLLQSLREGDSLYSALNQHANNLSLEERGLFLQMITRSGIIEDIFEIHSPTTA